MNDPVKIIEPSIVKQELLYDTKTETEWVDDLESSRKPLALAEADKPKREISRLSDKREPRIYR